MKYLLHILALLLCFNVAFAEDEIYDPWESYIRAIFDFNDTLDVYIAEPVARG